MSIKSDAYLAGEKPFCITNYNWRCKNFYSTNITANSIVIEGDYCVDYEIDKTDAIAIAKHFKLTAEDLK